MKISNILKAAVVAFPLFMASCHTHKNAVKEAPQPVTPEVLEQSAFLEKVNDNATKA